MNKTLRFPTFTRSIARKKPPPDPTIHLCSEIHRGHRGVRGAAVGGRGARGPDGFPRHHTAALLKKAPTNISEAKEAEGVRAALRNSSHVSTVAILLDQALAAMGLKELKGPMQIAEAHVTEAMKRFLQVKLEDGGTRGGTRVRGRIRVEEDPPDDLTTAGEELMDALDKSTEFFETEEDLYEKDKALSSKWWQHTFAGKNSRGQRSFRPRQPLQARLVFAGVYRPRQVAIAHWPKLQVCYPRTYRGSPDQVYDLRPVVAASQFPPRQFPGSPFNGQPSGLGHGGQRKKLRSSAQLASSQL